MGTAQNQPEEQLPLHPHDAATGHSHPAMAVSNTSATMENVPAAESTPVTALPATKCMASVLYDIRDLRYEERTIPPLKPEELQVAIKATGICGSDVSYYQKRRNGDICCSQGGLCLGHESSGIVVAIGSEVKGFKIGDRVALEVGVPCDSCKICRKGRYNLCKKMKFRSSAKSNPPFQGTLQGKINHPAMWCHKIPDSVSFEAAALLEPLSVAMHACNRAEIATASSALVIGAGSVGLLTAATARQAGCTTITVVDVDAGRVEYAIKNGFATHGYTVPRHSPPQIPSIVNTPSTSGSSTPATGIMSSFINTTHHDLCIAKALATDILSLTQNIECSENDEDVGVDYTFECTGKEPCMQTALYATRPGGRVIVVGMGTPIQTLPMSASQWREVDILPIFRYCNTYDAGIKLLESGRLPNLNGMVTHKFRGLENAAEAFELAGLTKDDNGDLVLKVIIEC